MEICGLFGFDDIGLNNGSYDFDGDGDENDFVDGI